MRIPLFTTALVMAALASPALAETLTLKVEQVAAGLDTFSESPVVNITFDPEGRDQFARLTAARVGEQVQIRLGDRVLSQPIIREPILAGQLAISGQLTEDTAQALVRDIVAAGNSIDVVGSDK